MMKIVSYLLQILVFVFFQSVSAQNEITKRVGTGMPWQVGFSSGISYFVTSISPEMTGSQKQINYWHRKINPGFGVSVVKAVSPALGVEATWLNTTLSGSWNDRWSLPSVSAGQENPLTFKTQLNQFDLMMSFNINQMMLPGDEEDIWHLYFKTGLGISDIRDTKIKKSRQRLGFMLDIGASVSISERIKLMAGTTYRLVNTDLLDGMAVTTSDPTGKQVALMKTFEVYNYTYLRVNYVLGRVVLKK